MIRPIAGVLRSPVAMAALVFAACARPPATTGAPSAELAPRMTPTTSAMLLLGDSLFNNNSCKKCHGLRGQGGQFAPDLTRGPWLHISGDYPEIVRIITDGVPPSAVKDTTAHPYDMHPRGGSDFSDEKVRALAVYVWSISRHKTR